MKILWLASWYPSLLEPFNGDFIKRHAEAVSLYHDVDVMHVIKDEKGVVTKDVHVENKQAGRLKEQIIYYYNPFQKVTLLSRVVSHWKYKRIFKKQIKKYLKENRRPDLVHLHVCLKAGHLALWMKRKYGLRYVVTEHSTFFLPEAKENIYKAPFYLKKLCRTILKKASAVSAVSVHLGRAVQDFAKAKGQRYSIIPNTVNTEIFQPITKTNDVPFELIHISSLSPQKNFETILEALQILKARQPDFILRVFGSDGKAWRQKIVDSGLDSHIFFYGELPQQQLALYLQKADALILFSRYETFGCVLIEAMACGVPVVVNDIPPMQEIVHEKFNGLVVENNVVALAKRLSELLEKRYAFNKWAIAKEAKNKYKYETIGHAFSFFMRKRWE